MYNVNSLVENLLKVEATDHRKIQEENKKSNPPSSRFQRDYGRTKKLIEK